MRFMVTVQLEIPPERRSELPQMLAAENAYVAEQLQQGILEAIYLADGAPTVWAVLKADSLEEAQRIVAGFPMYAYIRLTYTPLR